MALTSGALRPVDPAGELSNWRYGEPPASLYHTSVLAGDRSLVSLIARELAHSWSGNLATNATCRDIWLNERTTSSIEARLMEELYGSIGHINGLLRVDFRADSVDWTC